MTRVTVWTSMALIGILALLAAFSCGGGGGSAPAAMTLRVERGDCPDTLSGYMINAYKPYDRGFAGPLGAKAHVTTWPDLPQESFSFQTVLDAKVDGSTTQFTYTTPIQKTWLPKNNQATLLLSCQVPAAQESESCGHPDSAYLDPAPIKPALLWSLATVNAVFTIPPACNWFTKAELLRKVKDEASGAIAYTLIGNTELNNGRRGMIYWHAPDLVDGRSELLLRLTMAGGKIQEDLPFLAPVNEGGRLDFEIGCDPAKATHFVRLRTTEGIVCSGQEPQADGDPDADEESSAAEENESTQDGDLEPESDGDNTDAENDLDPDITETDADTENDATDTTDTADTEEAEIACGTTNPNFNSFYSAESTFNKQNSIPSDLAAIVTTTNTQFPDGTYVRLDATQTGGELDFTFNLADPWTYKFLITFVGGDTGFGVVSLYIDGSPTPIPRSDVPNGQNADRFDLNFAQIGGRPEWLFTMETYEPVCLSAGVHTLRVKVVGTTSSGYKAGLDRFNIVSN